MDKAAEAAADPVHSGLDVGRSGAPLRRVWDRAVRRADWVTAERVAMYSVPLLFLWVASAWLTMFPDERTPDFAALWAAGKMIVDGAGPAVYTEAIHASFISAALPQAEDPMPFLYPPPGLPLVAWMGLVPFSMAFAVWTVLGVVAYARTVWAVVPRAVVVVGATAAGFSVWNLHPGQTGLLLTAALGGAFLLLDRRPVLAGLLLASFVIKPHLGLLLVLPLVAQRRWATLGSAVATAAALTMTSGWLFGWSLWIEYVDVVRWSTRTVDGLHAGRFEVQSVFAVGRGLGLPSLVAGGAQLAVTAAAAVAVWRLWRCPDIDRSALIGATIILNLIASPRVFTYDAQMVALASVFVVAGALRTDFLAYERAGLVVANLLPLASLADLPATFAAMVILLLLALRRALGGSRRSAAVDELHSGRASAPRAAPTRP